MEKYLNNMLVRLEAARRTIEELEGAPMKAAAGESAGD